MNEIKTEYVANCYSYRSAGICLGQSVSLEQDDAKDIPQVVMRGLREGGAARENGPDTASNQQPNCSGVGEYKKYELIYV